MPVATCVEGRYGVAAGVPLVAILPGGYVPRPGLLGQSSPFLRASEVDCVALSLNKLTAMAIGSSK
jgi:hypothetical protein